MKQSAKIKRDRVDSPDHPSPSGVEKEDWILQQLRQFYDETLTEPIPDRLLDLLKQIDKKDSEGK